jgi:hypothetical protein
MLVAMVTSAALAGAGDDFGLLLVVLGVEDGMNDAALEHAGEVFADLDRDGPDEDGTALAVDS